MEMLTTNRNNRVSFGHVQKSIKCLLIACDQNSLYLQENDEERNLHETPLKPTLGTSHLIENSLRDQMRVAFLTNDNPDESCDESRQKSFLPDSVELLTVSPEDKSYGFSALAKEFSSDPREVLFVAADRKLRGEAAGIGCQVAAHPALAEILMKNNALYFCELYGVRSIIKDLTDMVPYYQEAAEEGEVTVFAALSQISIVEAARAGIKVNRLPLDLATQDPMLVRVDHWDNDTAQLIEGREVVSAKEGYVLIALDADDENDVLHVHDRHGHFWMMMPSPHLLDEVDRGGDQDNYAISASHRQFVESVINQNVIKALKFPLDLRVDLSCLFPKCAGSSYFKNNVERYSGVLSLDSAGTIASREVRHPDNARVVTALLADLRAMGYCAWTHSFSYGGQTAKNVIAELPGTGCLKLAPKIFQKIYHIFDVHRHANPVTPWLEPIEELLGKEWSCQLRKQAKNPWQLRQLIEWQLGIYPRPPLLLCPMAGFGAKTVVVGCHLDSTAASDSGFDPHTDAAPGADDNASGIAGTLSVAKYLIHYRGKLKNTVRFCFFNAEEVGLVGSQAYAAYLKSVNTQIKATICMDMIGYNTDTNKIFEVHAGYTDPAIRDLSVPIANQIAASATQLGQLGSAQIYKGTNPNYSSNRNTHDGAINRSDHASFHQYGYPAVVVSEDFFVNLPSEPSADANPNYHRQADTVIDSSYGAQIACAVAHATRQLAK